jgi:phosphoribosylformimino-5-aminoimidazole carboxamide ribotide isomerase
MIHGWVEKTNFNTKQVLSNFNNSKIKGFVLTDVSRDGMLKGINIDKVKNYLKISKKPFIVGGGLSDNNDLKNLLNLNDPLLEGVIAGKSFYLGKIDIKTAQEILN